MLISVVVPCYNEQEVLPLFYDKIKEVSAAMKSADKSADKSAESGLNFEFLFIDDGSKDGTLAKLRELAAADGEVRFISFSRNFGKESAMLAGLEGARGDYAVVMDADLQHPPDFIPQMYEYVKSGEYDSAATRRVNRKGESKIRSFFARNFYKVMNKISQTEIVEGAQDYRFMTRKMVNAILDLTERGRFSKGIFSWVGFKTKYIEYENVERAAGTTAWSFWGLVRYSIDGICAFSTAPLSIPMYLGIAHCLLAFIGFVVLLILDGFATESILGALFIFGLFFMGGLIMIWLGVVGQYLAKTFMEVKGRPVYIVRETEEDVRRAE